MKTLLSTVLLLFSVFSILIAQSKKEAELDTVIIKTTIDYNSEQIKHTVENPLTTLPENIAISLNGSDIVIKFSLKKDKSNKIKYDISPPILKNSFFGQEHRINPENLYGDIGIDVGYGEKTITIANTSDSDNEKWLNGDIEILLIVEKYILLDKAGRAILSCDDVPTIGVKDFKWQIAGGIIGGGLLSAGIIMKKNALEIYENDYKTQETKEAALPLYENANTKHHNSKNMRLAGGIILGANAIWTLIKYSNHRQNVKAYYIYCENRKAVLVPFYNPNSTPLAPNGQVGLNFTYTF